MLGYDLSLSVLGFHHAADGRRLAFIYNSREYVSIAGRQYIRPLLTIPCMDCLCEFLSNVWCQMLRRPQPTGSSMELVLERLTSRQIQLEVQDRRCVCEARRHHASSSRVLFRSKMLEHRRLQAQLLQLQRYRENVIAQMDAMSNHAINQTYVQAVRGASELRKGMLTVEDATEAFEGIDKTLQEVREVSEFLGQPLMQDTSDEDLEREFMEEIAVPEREPLLPPAATAPVAVTNTTLAATVVPRRAAVASG
jgi:hypothetical protein